MSGLEAQVLAHRLQREANLQVHRFRYPSTGLPVGEITARLNGFIAGLGVPAVHLVGHSLGGLVIHRLLQFHPAQPPGRVVFLGTPALGSLAAERAARFRPLAALMGLPVAEELLRARERRWGGGRELGIIAGSRALGLGRLFAGFKEDNDGTVAVRETRLPGAAAHLTLPVSHLGMLVSARVARETAAFLAHGRFTSQGSSNARSR